MATPEDLCVCGHAYLDHNPQLGYCVKNKPSCDCFQFMPALVECVCGHGQHEHLSNTRCVHGEYSAGLSWGEGCGCKTFRAVEDL